MAAYSDLFQRCERAQSEFIGYPCNLLYDYTPLHESLKYHFNNVGSPYEDSLYKTNTKDLERNVLRFFEDLWGFEPNNVWGYLTANGSTEGNLQAMFIAREVFPDGILYTSEDTHYSIAKIARILRIPLVKVKTHDNGEMNYEDFEQKLLSNLDKPAIINANLGTTMKGATDNTREIYRIICKHGKQSSYFMHADGALMGFVLPFIEHDVFFKKCIHSISISSHKFLGVPFPCGVFMMEKRFLEYINKNHVEYIDNNDCTIAGSRNGHSALFMDYIINQKGKDGFKDDIMGCINRAEDLINKLNDLDMNAWRNQNSITVVFDRPDDAIIKKWQLASQGKHSHAVVLPHVSQEYIERFVAELRLSNNQNVSKRS